MLPTFNTTTFYSLSCTCSNMFCALNSMYQGNFDIIYKVRNYCNDCEDNIAVQSVWSRKHKSLIFISNNDPPVQLEMCILRDNQTNWFHYKKDAWFQFYFIFSHTFCLIISGIYHPIVKIFQEGWGSGSLSLLNWEQTEAVL